MIQIDLLGFIRIIYFGYCKYGYLTMIKYINFKTSNHFYFY